jgi:hypothetical protein
MYSQYCMEDLSLVSRIEPRMDMMQMPNSIIDKAETWFFFQLTKIASFPSLFLSSSSSRETHRTVDRCIRLYNTREALCILSICRIQIVGGWWRV